MGSNKLSLDIIKNYYKCGGYHGDNGLNSVETSLGMYLYVYENILGINSMVTNDLNSAFKIGQLSILQKFLETYAKKCINKKDMVLHYSTEDFINQFENMPDIQNVALIMPYFVHFVALKEGYECENSNFLIDNNDHYSFYEPIKAIEPLNIEDTIKSINYKLKKTKIN